MVKKTNWTMAMWLAAFAQGCVTPSGELGGVDDSEGTATDGGTDEEISGSGMVDTGGDDTTGGDGGAMACEYDAGASVARAMSRRQFENTVEDLLGIEPSAWSTDEMWSFLPEQRVGPFAAPPLEGQEQTLGFAMAAIAASNVVDPASVLPCSLPAADPEQCIESFINDFGRMAWRRPLTPDEVDSMLTVYNANANMETGTAGVIASLLGSPNTTSLEMTGTPAPNDADVTVLDDRSRATRLAFFLWNSTPDAQLLEQAEAGALSDPDTLHAEAERMLADARATRMVGDFYMSLLDLESLHEVTKDPERFPQFGPELLAAMEQELRLFTGTAVLGEGAGLETVMAGPYTFVDDQLAAIYGDDILSTEGTPGSESFVRATLDPERRGGVLSLPAMLATHSYASELGFTHRGLMIRQNLLCMEIPPPPPDVDTEISFPEAPFDRYELYDDTFEGAECVGCHALFDSLSFGLDHYDPLGQWQEEIYDVEVDASGELLASDNSGSFDGRAEMVDRMLGSDDLTACTVQQYLRFALRRSLSQEDECTTGVLTDKLAQSNGDLQGLLLDIVDSSAFASTRAL